MIALDASRLDAAHLLDSTVARSCKEIDTIRVLGRIWDVNAAGRWATWFYYPGVDNSVSEGDVDDDILLIAGRWVAPKLWLAKARKLYRRGLILGCTCGCRGDYVVTPKGCAMLGRGDHGTTGY